MSQPAIVLVTMSAASCWTKWPAPGMVTSVRSLSIHFQVSLSAPGSSAWSFKPWIKRTEHLTAGKSGMAGLVPEFLAALFGKARVVCLVVVEHAFERRSFERGEIDFACFGIFDPASQKGDGDVLGGVWLLKVARVLAVLLLLGVSCQLAEEPARMR